MKLERCCDGMRSLIQEGAITPYTAFDHRIGQMFISGNGREIREYNELTNCQICGRQLNIIMR
jgi:hypothetical protein